MSKDVGQLRKELLGATEKELEVEKVVQLCRIADALVSLDETGIYTHPTENPEEEPTDRRR